MPRKPTQKNLAEQCEKVTVRFAPSQAARIAEQCRLAGLRPAQYVRVAAFGFTEHRHLDLIAKLGRVEDELIRLRRDFNDAVVDSGTK